jgi:hypothetical protein
MGLEAGPLSAELDNLLLSVMMWAGVLFCLNVIGFFKGRN